MCQVCVQDKLQQPEHIPPPQIDYAISYLIDYLNISKSVCIAMQFSLLVSLYYIFLIKNRHKGLFWIVVFFQLEWIISRFEPYGFVSIYQCCVLVQRIYTGCSCSFISLAKCVLEYKWHEFTNFKDVWLLSWLLKEFTMHYQD